MTTRDDELLGVLAASLDPPPDVEPTWAEISRLHRVIDAGVSPRRPSRTRLWRVHRPLTAVIAGVVVLGGASAAAALSGAVMPQPVRVAARAVGLPVDSPQLADARAALVRLREALAHQPRDLGAIRSDAQDVRDRLGRLSADDRSQVDPEATFLLAAADTALAPPPTSLGASPAPASPAPASAAAAPGGDDHGGRAAPSPPEAEHPTTGTEDHQSGDDHGGSSLQPSGSGVSGPGPSGSSGDGDHTATTLQNSTSGHDGGSSSGGGSFPDGGGSSGSGGGHSGRG